MRPASASGGGAAAEPSELGGVGDGGGGGDGDGCSATAAAAVEEGGERGVAVQGGDEGGLDLGELHEATGPRARRPRPPRYLAELALRSALRPRRTEIEDLLSVFWLPAAIFGGAEVLAFLGIRRSVFVALTDGAFELGPAYAAVVEVHVWASAAMWAMAAVQVLGERLRKSPETAWIHRRTGEAMLGLFFLVVLPTSLYLSALQRIDYLAPAVVAVLLDTAFCTMYFLYRGWRVARGRRTAKSLCVHGRLMQCGAMMSMSILPQRLLQLYLTCQLRQNHQLNYTVSILLTSVLFVLFGHFLDGPRGGIWLACIGEEHAEEAYGSARPSRVERLGWRLRWPLYVAAYQAFRLLRLPAAPGA